jgi:hypothetical protein
MVRALMDGRKTQTRRLLNRRNPYVVGDRLWVREQWQTWPEYDKYAPHQLNEGWKPEEILYTADRPDGPLWDARLRSAMHMPRKLSRLTLRVAMVRAERLQVISPLDARAEGARDIRDFADLWNSIHGTCAWDENPLVCALTFTVEKRNIDA